MVLLICAILFFLVFTKVFWKAAFWCSLRIVTLLKIVFMIVIPLSFLSTPQFFLMYGWSPMTLMFGKNIYNGTIVNNKRIQVVNGEIKLIER